MKVGIMQPYFLPYIGYFQLINAVDKFVLYDNIQFSKKSWVNRNRILVDSRDEFITIPLKKDSDFLNIDRRQLADTHIQDIEKLLRKIKESYRKAPYFNQVSPLIEDIFRYNTKNLFSFVFYSIKQICNFLGINTELVISSAIDVDHSLKSEQRILEILRKMNAQTYINAIGGRELYSKENFLNSKLELKFIRSDSFDYKQFENEFVPWLSILDVMMFNPKDRIKVFLNLYSFQ